MMLLHCRQSVVQRVGDLQDMWGVWMEGGGGELFRSLTVDSHFLLLLVQCTGAVQLSWVEWTTRAFSHSDWVCGGRIESDASMHLLHPPDIIRAAQNSLSKTPIPPPDARIGQIVKRHEPAAHRWASLYDTSLGRLTDRTRSKHVWHPIWHSISWTVEK